MINVQNVIFQIHVLFNVGIAWDTTANLIANNSAICLNWLLGAVKF